MWADEPIFGKWNDLNLIGRRLVSQRYLHAVLPPWLHLSGSFYRLIKTCLDPITSLVTPFTPLRNSTAGIVTLHTTHTQPTIPMMFNPALPQSASATAEAQEPYDFRTLPSMLRVLEPSALHTPELSPLANTVGSGLGVDLPQKMFHFLLSSTHVMVKS